MKNIVITGASGLIGTALIDRLLNQCHTEFKIYAVTSNPNKLKISDSCLSIIAPNQLEDILKSNTIEVLVQLAFPRNVSNENWAAGIKYAMNVIFLAKKYGVERLINVSSQSIYGLQREEAANENDAIILNSPYTTGKYCTELLAEGLFREGTFTNIRLSTIIGPTTKERVPNKLFANILSGNKLTIKGGQQQFSFLDVRDAADGLLCIISKTVQPWKPAYNLGTREVCSLLSIAEKCNLIASEHGYAKAHINLIVDDTFLSNELDVTLFEKDFGWIARYNLNESLTYILDHNGGIQ